MYIFDKELFREDYLRMGKPKHKLDFHLLGWVAKVDGKEVKFKKGEDKAICNKFQIHKDWCREVK